MAECVLSALLGIIFDWRQGTIQIQCANPRTVQYSSARRVKKSSVREGSPVTETHLTVRKRLLASAMCQSESQNLHLSAWFYCHQGDNLGLGGDDIPKC